MSCDTCAYLITFDHPQLVGQKINECHRNAPTAFMIPTQSGPGFISTWPPIADPSDGRSVCGDWAERPPQIQQ